MQAVRLGIVEDQKLVLRLLHDICATRFGYDVAMLAATSCEGFEKAVSSRPEVMLVDFNLPDGDGISLGKRIIDRLGPVKIIILSAENTQFVMHRARQSGLAGYLDKSCDPDLIAQAIKAVTSGGFYFPSPAGKSPTPQPTDSPPVHKVLSDREIELLPSLGLGHADEAIAKQFGLTPSTVRSHRKNILGKLNLHSAIELMRFCYDHGFVTRRPDGGSRPAISPEPPAHGSRA